MASTGEVMASGSSCRPRSNHRDSHVLALARGSIIVTVTTKRERNGGMFGVRTARASAR